MKFTFSKELKADLAGNGKEWDNLLFRACMEAKSAECKASDFAQALRKSGFRCGTGPARTAYKAVRDGGDIRAMVKAVAEVKAKRKAQKTAETATAETATAETATAETATAETATAETATAETLVGALMNAVHAASEGKLEVAESWLVKAQAMLATAKLAIAKTA